jgi:cyclic pyranopterin phosphate synthase
MTLPVAIPGLEMPVSGPLIDPFGRAHTYVRISVTDRCNFRCTYCMPEEGLDWMPRDDLLHFEEIARIAQVFASMGVRRVRLTGGEPTMRRDLVSLVGLLAAIPGIEDLSLTTNAHRLAELAAPLKAAGLTRVNVSLDAVDPVVFREMTRTGDLERVLAGIDAAIAEGLTPVKINAVVVRGVNDDHVLAMLDRFKDRAADVALRFIEFMPFSKDERGKHVPSSELRARIGARYPLTPVGASPGGPAVNWRIDGGLLVGFISPITEHFCDRCNRLRLMADGHLRTCLSRDDTPSLRDLLRSGASDEALALAIRQMVWGKVAGHEAHLEDGAFRGFEGTMTRIGG